MQVILNIFFHSALLLQIAIGFSIIYRVAHFFHIAHAIIISLGAYFLFLFNQQLELPILISIPFAISLCILVGLSFEIFLYKKLRNKNSHSFVFLIVSLGMYVIIQNIISLVWGDATQNIRIGVFGIDSNYILGAYITTIQLITIGVSFLVFVLYFAFFYGTKIGMQMRAVSSNCALANIFGINSNKSILLAFAIGSGLAAISGILVAFDTDMRPGMGFNYFLYGVVVMIISGNGRIWGLLVGSFLLAIAQQLGAYYIDGKWMDAIAYIILILFLIWKPLGFSSTGFKKVEI